MATLFGRVLFTREFALFEENEHFRQNLFYLLPKRKPIQQRFWSMDSIDCLRVCRNRNNFLSESGIRVTKVVVSFPNRVLF